MKFDNEMEATIWAMCFSSVCGIQFHPKNERKAPYIETVQNAALVADAMIVEYRERVPNPGSSVDF